MISLKIKAIGAFALLIVISAGAASADIYKFRDEEGVMHFTNNGNLDMRYKLYIKYHNHPTVFIVDYGETINQAAQKYGVESCLIKAVIRAESGFNHRAESSKGAKGLMQLMPYTAGDLSVNDPYDPKDNIFGGTKYLRRMLERFNNNTQFALAAYNAGPENVDAYNGIPPFEETKNFVKRVLTFYNQYKSESK
jgi:soluble lytic murein transglycosylase-like protein